MMQGFVRLSLAAFALTVVHDGNARFEGGVCDIRSAMMCDEVNVHRADHVFRTGQVEQRLPTEVAHIEKAEFSVAQDDAGRAGVLESVLGWSRLRRTRGICRAGAR